MQWTDEQKRAIETRGTNILLSAAAGSGKTTVLVSRVLELISGGAGIDRMLIVTFTRAASADMRAKLKRELGKRAAAGDENCRSQQLLMERATITTIHGFCSEFLRTHFETAGVDPAFRVLDDTETRRLLDEALDEALEEAYTAPDEKLLALDYARGPKGVRNMADLLVQILDERPDPEAWLERASHPDAALEQAWLNALVASAHAEIDRAILLLQMGVDHPGCNGNYYTAMEQEIKKLKELQAVRSYDELYRALYDYKLTPVSKGRDAFPIHEEVKKLRLDAKAAIEKIALRSIDLGTALKDAEALTPALEALGSIALRARTLFDGRKAEISALSYSDLEHRTLAALRDDDTARAVRESYDYVFVDEYQDTSDVQEAIVRRIVRGDNLFMVGDVKQSIYRFRQAEPRLFLEKYENYGRGNGGALLPLTRNFRSRPGILDFVNRVFERAMRGGDSEIMYDELARLNPGDSSLTGGSVELHLLETETAEEDAQELNNAEREALFIAGRIRELMLENPGLHYRDFAILTRNKRGVLGRMAAILTQQGIPAFADGSEEYFDSVEVALALSLLKLTANRRSDVELIGVLRSPIVGLSNEELSRIRIANPDVPFVDAALACAALEGDTARQLKDFFDLLEKWRLMSLCSDLGLLTRTIFEESGLADCAAALPGGAQRRANLDHLCANAAAFDQTVSGSLTRFLAHVEKLREKGDGDSAHVLGENDDVVRLMTVHKSKGLEFPVVFGALLARKFSAGSRTAALTAHRDLGLGCMYCDPGLQTRRRTLPQLAIAETEKRQDRAEELRILYVLLTRARDQLILSGCVKSAEGIRTKAAALRAAPSAAGSHLEVVLSALEEDFPVQVHDGLPPLLPVEAPVCESGGIDPKQLEALRWKYPEEQAARQPLKLTVTGLLRELHAPDAAQELIERPAFLSETPGRMTGAERGTAYHRVMQSLRLDALRGRTQRALSAEIRRQMQAMADAGRISQVQMQAVYAPALAQFFAGETGQRLLAAENVQREWPFNLRMRISEALTAEEAGDYGEEEILVQGAIDCCFAENGSWILLDYKTDRSDDAAALTQRYQDQLRMYALALERITGMPVAEIRLCLLRAGESILIPR